MMSGWEFNTLLKFSGRLGVMVDIDLKELLGDMGGLWLELLGGVLVFRGGTKICSLGTPISGSVWYVDCWILFLTGYGRFRSTMRTFFHRCESRVFCS